MSEPRMTAKMPAVLQLEPGTYNWCACGGSKNQPFCDGSHQGTEFSPMQITIEENKRVALCQCRQSGNKPFCDGTHATL